MSEYIPRVIVPEGYRGKILLVLVRHAGEEIIVLRSGDLWHREILRNARTEIAASGLTDAEVEQIGGAYLTFVDSGTIEIGGTSEEFGRCDLDHAADLIRSAWPEWNVVVR